MKQLVKKHILPMIMLLLCINWCCACEFFHAETFHPKEGLWYCDELNLQITFGEFLEDPIEFYTNGGYLSVSDEEYYRSHIVIDGKKYRCGANTPKDQPTLIISYDDIRYNETYPNEYSIGEELFRGTAVKSNGNEYFVKEDATEKTYRFVRIE